VATKKLRKVLLLGWNHAAPALLQELEGYENETFEVDILSLVPKAERRDALDRRDVKPTRISVNLIEGEYTSLPDLRALNTAAYDNVVVLASDRLESEGERDARSILGSLVLREALGTTNNPPPILVEILNEDNVPLVADAGDESVLSPVIMSHILTQVALNRNLRVVYDGLFGTEGAEIFFRSADDYGVCNRPVKFSDVQAAATASSEIALGMRINSSNSGYAADTYLNPSRGTTWNLNADDQIVVLALA
jgi:hypothetical protein